MAQANDWPKYAKDISYSDESALNTLETCIPRPAPSEDSNRLWIIFIHGGAWLDPCIDASSFKAIQDKLLSSTVADRIAGYASLNYRLSPNPSHPTDPSDPSDPARNAKHPDHINDVLTAILYLQEKYNFEDRYIIAGHSAGTTLALQVAMKRYWGSQYESTFALELNVVPPICIVGLEGIYDIPALLEYHKNDPEYQGFISNAFGNTDLASVSPTNGDFDESWPDGKLVVLAHSLGDTLVEMEQPALQERALEAQGWKQESERRVLEFELKGDHDEVWENGDAAQAIEFAIAKLFGTELK